ncbi:hypothetical protein D3C78_1476430 [compost metagenome]
MLAALGDIVHVRAGELLQVDVRAAANACAESKDQTDDQGDGGEYFEVDDRLEADAPDLLEIAGTGDTTDHHAEHDQADEHLDQLDKAVAEGFELCRIFGKGKPADDAEHQSEDNLKEDRPRAPFEHGRDSWFGVLVRQGGLASGLHYCGLTGLSSAGAV